MADYYLNVLQHIHFPQHNKQTRTKIFNSLYDPHLNGPFPKQFHKTKLTNQLRIAAKEHYVYGKSKISKTVSVRQWHGRFYRQT